ARRRPAGREACRAHRRCRSPHVPGLGRSRRRPDDPDRRGRGARPRVHRRRRRRDAVPRHAQSAAEDRAPESLRRSARARRQCRVVREGSRRIHRRRDRRQPARRGRGR
ncbi:hypothetical protein LTR94_034751, partial [Friedmanniomyces endolithicus]